MLPRVVSLNPVGCLLGEETVFCLGMGKNLKFLEKLNATHRWLDSIVPLEHPRYIMQYKSKQVEAYIEKYLHALVDA